MPGRQSLSIRAANARDAGDVAALLATVDVKVDPILLSARLEESLTQFGQVLLAEEWGPPTGVLALHWRWDLIETQKVAEISLLLVDPDQRRRGIGRLLLKAGSRLARAAGCGTLRLVVSTNVEPLSAFGAATGFEKEGEVLKRSLRKHAGSA